MAALVVPEFTGRILLAGLAIKAVATLAGLAVPSTAAALDAVDAVGSLALRLRLRAGPRHRSGNAGCCGASGAS